MTGWNSGGSNNYRLNILTVVCDFLQFLQANTMLVPFSILLNLDSLFSHDQ